MHSVTVKINGRDYSVKEGATILESCREIGVDIPTLCYHPDLSVAGNCRLCVVEVEGWRTLVPACVTPITPNMVVRTDSPRVRRTRKLLLELLLANHNNN